VSAIKSALLIGFALMLVVACTSSSTSDGSLTICRNLPSSDTCSVNLSYLSCTYENDAGQEITELCLSDNINACPDGSGLGGCTNQCANGEYSAVCIGSSIADAAPQTVAPPSPSCHLLASSSGVYCCPCGS
jgi:hypothetical protein